jgi:hypothetical protein
VDNGRKAKTADAERLVKASQAGDRTAFDELVRLYQRPAMQAAVRMLGSANEAAVKTKMEQLGQGLLQRLVQRQPNGCSKRSSFSENFLSL